MCPVASAMRRDFMVFTSRQICSLEYLTENFYNISTARLLYFSYPPTFFIADGFICF